MGGPCGERDGGVDRAVRQRCSRPAVCIYSTFAEPIDLSEVRRNPNAATVFD